MPPPYESSAGRFCGLRHGTVITSWDTVATNTQASEGGYVRAILNGTVIAESPDPVVVEGNPYFPSDAVDPRVLTRSRLHTVCVWKGVASYYHVTIDGQTYRNAAWYYPRPYPWVRRIKNRVAFSPLLVSQR